MNAARADGKRAESPLDAERLSELIDGELAPDVAQALITTLCRDAAAQRRWMELHRVGDALHSSEVAASHSAGFCSRVSAAIAMEATVLAPRATERQGLRRYWLPTAAVAASAAVVGFIAMPLVRGGTETVTASAPVAVVAQAAREQASSRRAAMTVANARSLDPYLLAHREMTGGAALPRATPYLRTVVDRPESR